MDQKDRKLVQWARQPTAKRESVTLGQLLTLLELSGSRSVAEMGGDRMAQAVNYRQKLDRLGAALGLGRLTERKGKTTQPTALGRRLAGEVRLLLSAVSAAESAGSHDPLWIFGAGDAWLQSIVVPALGNLASRGTGAESRWEVKNLRSHDICLRLRDGQIHFGLIRKADLQPTNSLEVAREYSAPSYAIVAGDAGDAPSEPKKLILWLAAQGRTLIQQGTSWQRIRTRLAKRYGLPASYAELEPAIVCESHAQAVSAALRTRCWCIAPAHLVHATVGGTAKIIEALNRDPADEMALVYYPRALEKQPNATRTLSALKIAIGRAMRSE